MARIRSIKPETFTSETLAGCSVHARWTFGGLWCYVDDEGRGKSNAGLIKAAVWPLDDDITPQQVEGFLDELEAARLICRYEMDGKSYLHVVNFSEHQHPNRPVASKIPACSRRTHGGLTETTVSPPPKGPVDPPATASESPVVPIPSKQGKSGRSTTKAAGQDTLTADSVSTHGVRTTDSPTTPPTPLHTVEGVGDGVVVPPPAARKRARPDAAETEVTAGTLVAEWIRSCRKRPPDQVIGQVSSGLKKLLNEEHDVEDIRAGLTAWALAAKHPSTLASFVNEAMNSGNGHGPASINQSTGARRAMAAIAAGEELQAMIDGGRYTP